MDKVVVITADFAKLEKYIEEMHSRFAELNDMDSWTEEEKQERYVLKGSLFAYNYGSTITGRIPKDPVIRNIKGNPNA